MSEETDKKNSKKDTSIKVAFIAALATILAALIGSGLPLLRNSENKNEVKQENIKAEEPKKESPEQLPKAELQDEDYIREAVTRYMKVSPDLKDILTRKLESKNIGGVVAVIQTNWQLNQASGEKELVFRQPEILGFKKIEGTSSLVNLAIKDVIEIQRVELKTVAKGKYVAALTLKNLTDTDISYVIPKGQVFENKQPIIQRQNVAAFKEENLVLPARTTRDIEIDALCINKDFAIPKGPGNITIFEIGNKNFNNQNDLWGIMKGGNSK